MFCGFQDTAIACVLSNSALKISYFYTICKWYVSSISIQIALLGIQANNGLLYTFILQLSKT